MDLKSTFKTGYTKTHVKKAGSPKGKKPIMVAGLILAAVATGFGIYSQLEQSPSASLRQNRVAERAPVTRSEPIRTAPAPAPAKPNTIADIFSAVTAGETKATPKQKAVGKASHKKSKQGQRYAKKHGKHAKHGKKSYAKGKKGKHGKYAKHKRGKNHGKYAKGHKNKKHLAKGKSHKNKVAKKRAAAKRQSYAQDRN